MTSEVARVLMARNYHVKGLESARTLRSHDGLIMVRGAPSAHVAHPAPPVLGRGLGHADGATRSQVADGHCA